MVVLVDGGELGLELLTVGVEAGGLEGLVLGDLDDEVGGFGDGLEAGEGFHVGSVCSLDIS